MRDDIDHASLKQILRTVERTYTEQLAWDAADNEVFIEGAVIDDVHGAIFDGEAPTEFAAPYIHVPSEEPRLTLSNRRRDEIRTFLQRNWRGPGGVLAAEESINDTIRSVVTRHRQRHSLSE